MFPWLSTVKDAVIIVAIVALGWWVYHAGQNSVHVSDFKHLQAQVSSMQAEAQRWQQEQFNAEQKLNTVDLPAIDSLAGAAAQQHVWLCDNGAAKQPVPSRAPAPAALSDTGSRGVQPGSRRDIGPAIAALKRKYETALAECRQALAAWPR